jgi:hypothetical protein
MTSIWTYLLRRSETRKCADHGQMQSYRSAGGCAIVADEYNWDSVDFDGFVGGPPFHLSTS